MIVLGEIMFSPELKSALIEYEEVFGEEYPFLPLYRHPMNPEANVAEIRRRIRENDPAPPDEEPAPGEPQAFY